MECQSCNHETNNGVKHPCPNCNKQIFRCKKCRNLSIDFKCGCGHEGP